MPANRAPESIQAQETDKRVKAGIEEPLEVITEHNMSGTRLPNRLLTFIAC